MRSFEYKVVPAPRRGEKAKGAKTSEEKFAVALMRIMNELGSQGWDYVRADTLPCDERAGLTGIKTSYLNMLVFRRPAQAGSPINVQDEDEETVPPFSALKAVTEAELAAVSRPLGAPTAPSGIAPAVGPAKQDQAAG